MALTALLTDMNMRCGTISDILGFPVRTNEVIEIDDGLKPYCFFVHEYGIELLAYFDRDCARKNKLDRTDLEEPDTALFDE